MSNLTIIDTEGDILTRSKKGLKDYVCCKKYCWF